MEVVARYFRLSLVDVTGVVREMEIFFDPLYLFGNHLEPASARFEAMNPCWSLGNSFEDAAVEVGGVSESEVESAEQVRLLV